MRKLKRQFLIPFGFLIVFTIGLSNLAFGQADSATIKGSVTGYDQEKLPEYPIYINNQPIVKTDKNGNFSIKVLAGKRYKVSIKDFDNITTEFTKTLEPGSVVYVHLALVYNELGQIDINKPQKKPDVQLITVEPKDLEHIPNIQMEDALVKLFLGVRRRSELSTSYNVRGGNFDENLIYINDIEVYRPFLARSGQQEGLSFVNPYMTNNVTFSSGGFAAKYGDKMSSVLDVEYNKPKEFSGSAEVSLLGASVHVQDRVDIKGSPRLTYVIGARYRTLQYILGSLDVSGDYRPQFVDFQSLIAYRLNSKLQLQWFSTYANNKYLVEPQSRETNFGTVQQAVRLFVAFGGAERIEYQTWLNAFTFQYKPSDSTTIKLISSNYTSAEQEHFTIEGLYRLEELENNLGSSNFAEAKAVLGTGYFINHARNKLSIGVNSQKLMGQWKRRNHKIEAGLKHQQEIIFDRLREWNYNDSAGYRVNASLYNAREIHLDDFISASNELNSHRYMAYVQDNVLLNKDYNARMVLGVRGQYWNLNEQLLVSPRMQFSIQPNKKYNDKLLDKLYDAEFANLSKNKEADYLAVKTKYDSLKRKDIVITAAAGVYGQPPFYRELRNAEGQLNSSLQAQESYHFVLGSDILFKAWNRPFRFINEVYYKRMLNLVPYTINNVKLRYDALNSSEGYTMGMDARVNGEFVSGLESWINLSILSTKENISYVDEFGMNQETGYIKRPTDQRVNFSILFQDELPTDTSFKMQLNLVVGSKMPYYFNGPFRYKETYNLPAYRRVDIGFSKQVTKFTKKSSKGGRFESLWMSLEVFNILQVNNVASYFWVEDLNNNIYGVPNYLTGRRLNLKIIGRF